MTGKPPAHIPHLDKKTSAALNISPGIVQDGEFLLREMYQPYHLEENGKIKKEAIHLTELRGTGVSVHRERYTSIAEVSRAIERRLDRRKRENKDPWKSAGVSVVEAGRIRKMRTPADKKAFVVTDTAERANRSHASIHCACPEILTSELRALRDMLLPILEESLMSVESAFASEK